MRKLLITICILITGSIYLFPQWSTDPNNNLVIGYGLNPELCSDSAGGCYITYEVGYPSELYLHRINKYGYQPWGDKRIITGELDEQSNAKIIGDGEGGVIVSYGDRIMNNSYRLRLQKVDSIGNFLWGPTGVKVSITDTRQSVQRLVTDGVGGCVIVWIDTLAEYKINRINNFGYRVWGDSGKVIAVDEYYDKPQLVRASDGNYYVQIRENLYRIRENGDIVRQDSTILSFMVPDSEGGIVFSGREWTGMTPKLTAQRIDSLGNNLWLEPYVEIADSIFINLSESIHPINEYYFFTWLGNKNGIELVSQYQALRSDGTILFNQGNLPISDYAEGASTGYILSSEDRTFVLIWQDNRPEDGVFGQRRDTLNNKLWNSVDVSIDTGIYSVLYAITDGMGGAIGGGWQLSDFSIRAFKVSKNGILGEVITNLSNEHELIYPEVIILYQNFPNPFNSSTLIQFQLPKEDEISITLYNILGEKIQSIVDGSYSKGIHSINFLPVDLTSGTYFYKLQTETKSLTKKLIIIK
jgi:hypothetical protein